MNNCSRPHMVDWYTSFLFKNTIIVLKISKKFKMEKHMKTSKPFFHFFCGHFYCSEIQFLIASFAFFYKICFSLGAQNLGCCLSYKIIMLIWFEIGLLLIHLGLNLELVNPIYKYGINYHKLNLFRLNFYQFWCHLHLKVFSNWIPFKKVIF